MEQFAPFDAQMQMLLWGGFVVFCRVGAMLFLLPAFGEQAVPLRVRLALALAFTAVVAPSAAPDQIVFPANPIAAVVWIVPEATAGLFFGLLLRFLMMALQIAGTIAAQSTSLSQIFGGSAGVDPQPAIGHVLTTAALALAAIMGLHVDLAAYMIQSYQLVPFGVLVMADQVAEIGVAAISRAFALGFTLAAPFVIASLIYNITLGVINRAMPQLMVSFVGAPAITAGGLLLLLLTAPVMLQNWHSAFSATLGNPIGAGL